MTQPASPAARRRILAALAASLVATTLPACGFKLRGPRPLSFASLYIGLDRNTSLYGMLRRQIMANGSTQVVDDPAQADARLEMLRDNRDREILSLSSAGRVREYTLEQTLGFRLVARDGRELLPPTLISARRDYNFDDAQVIAKEQEEALLYRDMEKDLVEQLVRRLAAVQP